MNAQKFAELKKKVVAEGLEDGAKIIHDGGPVFDADKSDWDAEGLNYILGSTKKELTDSQYNSLLNSYAKALTKGGKNAS